MKPFDFTPLRLRVFERGWLSSNNTLLLGRDDSEGALLVDSSHCLHAEQTLDLVRHGLGTQPLRGLINTHLHSDHCGGNAALVEALAVPVSIPSGSWAAVSAWDETALSYQATGQRCVRFVAQHRLNAGGVIEHSGLHWQVLAAPGHDPDSIMLFEPEHGVLISADALWQNGFGVVFPEIEGVAAFDDVGAVLDTIERLPVRVVIPGHGGPFTDVAAALERARQRLQSFRADPARHARHAAKVLIKYHLMEERSQAWAPLLAWAQSTPLLARLWADVGHGSAPSIAAWCEQLVADMAHSGALRLDAVGVADA